MLRFAPINTVDFALLIAARLEDWIGALLAVDTTGLVRVIVATFLVGLAWCTSEIARVSGEFDALTERHPPPDSAARRGAVPANSSPSFASR